MNTPVTLRDYDRGRRPKCAACGVALDPETDCHHDGYRGSAHAHGGRGSYGVGDHHFVFNEVCAACAAQCPVCAAKTAWEKLPAVERALAVSDQVGGLLCRAADGYWLVDDNNAHEHRVAVFFAWDDTKASRAEYVALVTALRGVHGRDFPAPQYVRLHQQPNHTRAAELLAQLEQLGIEVNRETLAVEPHSCAEALGNWNK